jgi:hypothetical protein
MRARGDADRLCDAEDVDTVAHSEVVAGGDRTARDLSSDQR